MKKIAIDTGPLKGEHKFRGIGMMTQELIGAFEILGDKNIKISAVDFEGADLSKYDLVHYQVFNPFFDTLPDEFPTKAVVTIHDLIYLIYPQHYPPGIRGKLRFWRQKRRVQKASAILTISETSKKDIIRFLGIKPQKRFTLFLAPKKIFRKLETTKRSSLPKRFVLYVGDVNYNKNLHTLIHACKLAKIPLVISGKKALEVAQGGETMLNELKGPMDWWRFVSGQPHPENAHYAKMAHHFRHNKNILTLGFVPDEDLVVLYNLATVYVQPSFYEGFGLSILEAMACGTPVIATRINTHVEIAEDAAIFVDPKDAKSMANKISEVVNNRITTDKLIKSGYNVVKKYSWKKTAQETLAVYND